MAGRSRPDRAKAPRGKSPPPKKRGRRAKPGARPDRSKKPTPVGKERKPVPKGRRWRLLGLFAVVGLLALTIDVALLWESVTERMEGRPHDEPARITGVLPRLAPGGVATREGWRQTWREVGLVEVAHGDVDEAGEFSMKKRKWVVWPADGPAIEVIVEGRRVDSMRRRDDRTKLAGWDFALPAISLMTGSSRERRTVVPLEDMPLELRRAVVAIEDERFYRHHGVDPRGIARAAVRNLQSGGVSQGGSTITQQLAKNMFLSADRTFARKGQEALLAGILEYRYDKDRLLEAYLNEIYLGQRDGYAIMGVGEAARAWFGKEVGALTLAESALLAGAIHAPNRTVPWRHAEEARRRRDVVLARMDELAAVPTEEIQAAIASDVTWTEGPRLTRRAPWFLDALSADLGDRYSAAALHRDGLELVSTLDPMLQASAEQAVTEHLAALRASHPELWTGDGGPQVALVAVEPRTGAVRALIGGADYGTSQFNRALQARRQPGSAFKPVVLAAAIGDRWPDLGPRTIVDDSPISVPGAGPGGRSWRPRNSDGRFDGTMSLREATERSRNLPFVHLGMEIGADRMRSAAEALGIRTPLAAVPSLAIGAQEVTPLDLASAYATLANGGMHVPARLLEGVRDREGRWLERAMPSPQAGIDPRVAAVVTDLLESVIDEGTARGVRRTGLRIPLAGKTGTSNQARDAWMVGCSPDLAVAVWMGFDSDRALGLSSTEAAVPLWATFMSRAAPFLTGDAFPRPRGTEEALRAGRAIRRDPARRRDLQREDRDRRRTEEEAMRAMER